jgi:cytochrome P450 monooxygenase OleP
VDELLRVMTLGNTGMLRVVTEDVELPSGVVHAGDTVVVATTSALRDEAVYTDPDEVRFGREAPPSLVFGGGAHYCLGAHLAKAEMQIGLSVLLERLPTLRLAVEVEDLEFSEGEILSSVLALPVTW